MHIAFPSRSTTTKHKFLAITRKIDKWLNVEFQISDFGFLGSESVNERPQWHVHNFARPGATSHFFPHPVSSILRLDYRLVKKTR